MKNKFSLLTFAMFFCGCIIIQKGQTSSTKTLISQEQSLYKVYKIDSIHSYYLIYARKKDTIYKIVSKKSDLENCNSILINQDYAFRLQGRIASRQASKFRLSPEASLLVNCFSYDDSTSVCLERDSINDLYSAENVRGLCFLKNYNR